MRSVPTGRVSHSLPGGRLRLLDLDSGQTRAFRGRHDGLPLRIEFTPDGRTIVTADDGGELFVWDVERGAIAQRLAGHHSGIDGLDITGDGRTLITASIDTRAILWDIAEIAGSTGASL